MKHVAVRTRLLLVAATVALSFVGNANAFEVNTAGPSGGRGGSNFDPCSLSIIDGAPVRISELRVRAGASIDSVQVVYSNGRVGPRNGGGGGSEKVFKLKPGENITLIGGKYGEHVDSLYIKTSAGRSQSWGGSGGDVDFLYTAPDGMWINGLFGRSGELVDAIGVCILDSR